MKRWFNENKLRAIFTLLGFPAIVVAILGATGVLSIPITLAVVGAWGLYGIVIHPFADKV